MKTWLSAILLVFVLVGCGSNNNSSSSPPPPPPAGGGSPGGNGAWPQQSVQYMVGYCGQQLQMNYGLPQQQAQQICSCYLTKVQQQTPNANTFFSQLGSNPQATNSAYQGALSQCYSQYGMSYSGSYYDYELLYYSSSYSSGGCYTGSCYSSGGY